MDCKSKKLTSKDALLEAAEKLFSENGYAAVSTRDIAEAAGVNLGAIQYHFGSKAKLFVDTIHYMMESSGCVKARLSNTETGSCKFSSAIRTCEFIQAFMDYLLRPTGPQPCRVMYREIFNDKAEDPEMYHALVDSISKDFTKPLEDTLSAVLKYITPQASQADLKLFAQSIIGQCSFYVTNKPFIEHLQGGDVSKSPLFEQICEHISIFSLRGLGLTEEMIRDVTNKVFHPSPSNSGSEAKV